MNESNWTHGQAENLVRERASFTAVDCSDWESDIPADQWTHGDAENLVRETKRVVEVDCSEWDAEPTEKSTQETKRYGRVEHAPVRMLDEIVLDCIVPTACLELRLLPSGKHDVKTYSDYARELVEKIVAIDRSLGLQYDAKRSTFTEYEVILFLNPGPVLQPEVRLAQILSRIRDLLSNVKDKPLTLVNQNLHYPEPDSHKLAA